MWLAGHLRSLLRIIPKYKSKSCRRLVGAAREPLRAGGSAGPGGHACAAGRGAGVAACGARRRARRLCARRALRARLGCEQTAFLTAFRNPHTQNLVELHKPVSSSVLVSVLAIAHRHCVSSASVLASGARRKSSAVLNAVSCHSVHLLERAVHQRSTCPQIREATSQS